MKHQRSRTESTEVVQDVCRFIEENLESELTLLKLAGRVHVSPGHLQRTFKRLLGITPRQYADARRIEKLKNGLKQNQTVTAAMYEAGYGSSSRLYERADGQLGMTPATYQRGGRGMSIRYTISACALGKLLIAGTERGISAVSLGDDDDSLIAELQREYPAANIERDSNTLNCWLDALLQHIAGNLLAVDLPLDVQATAFQRRVWQELQRIPYGTTKTYREIAAALGQPTAARAVARACAANPVSVIVPCHRVVREDGGLGGYRWGLDRKRTLLDIEDEHTP